MSEDCFSAVIMSVGTSVGAVITAIAGLILAVANAAKVRDTGRRVARLENGNGTGVKQ